MKLGGCFKIVKKLTPTILFILEPFIKLATYLISTSYRKVKNALAHLHATYL